MALPNRTLQGLSMAPAPKNPPGPGVASPPKNPAPGREPAYRRLVDRTLGHGQGHSPPRGAAPGVASGHPDPMGHHGRAPVPVWQARPRTALTCHGGGTPCTQLTRPVPLPPSVSLAVRPLPVDPCDDRPLFPCEPRPRHHRG